MVCMDGNVLSGVIGIIFLVLCIGFMSFMQPAERQASLHPFLDPQTASAAVSIELDERGTFTGRNR